MALTCLTNSSYSVYLTTFFTASLSLLKTTGAVSNLPISNLSTLLFKLLKPVGTNISIFSNISISNLSISGFKLAKSAFFLQNLMYQHLLRFLSQILLHS